MRSDQIQRGIIACIFVSGVAVADPAALRLEAALPGWVQSAEILRSDEAIFSGPSSSAQRRGSAALGARLPVFGASQGQGCSGNWLSVGPLAWVCESVVRLSEGAPLASRETPSVSADGLPHRYFFVGESGTLGYREFETAESGYPDAELEPDFVVAVVAERAHIAGDPLGLTTHGLWVPMRDLRAVVPSFYRGAEQPDLDLGWVVNEGARVFREPGRQRLGQPFERLTQVSVSETRSVGQSEWLRVGDHGWFHQKDLARFVAQEPPPGLRRNERWIDVDLERQTLAAYEGTRPVFATLVSSGRGLDQAPDATPKGSYRIWVKLRESDMDNLEDTEASRYYAIQSVPWVMYFKEGYGLHGAFWHRDFGRVRSHGCVNLSPLDAERLFRWTSPRLPQGWTAAFPTPYELGTLVRIR